jgi:anti-sigma B factor antagonist
MLVEKAMHGPVTVVSLVGDLDSATAAQVQTELTGLIPDDGRMLLDLGRISYISSAGLRVLLLLYRQARQRNMRLVLADVPADMREVMAATGFIDAFVVTDTVAAGVAELDR